MKTILKTMMIISMMTVCTNIFAIPHNHQTIIIDEDGCYAVRYAPKQKVHIDKIYNNFRTTVQPLRQTLRSEKTMLRAELLQPHINQKRVNQLVHNIESLHAQLLEKRVHTIIQTKQVPESTIILTCNRHCHHHKQHPYFFRADFSF